MPELTDAVVEQLSKSFISLEVTAPAANGKLLAFLNAHADIYRQEYRGEQVVLRCNLPRHLLHHIEGPGVEVRWLAADQRATGNGDER